MRPTRNEAHSLATGGGLYGGGGGGDAVLAGLSMVVVGHVDAGKSTLMGQLLVSATAGGGGGSGQGCAVTARQVRKFKEEAAACGKGSFFLAWVMDEGDAERAHGVTIDVASKRLETATKAVTVLDAPGHADFVPKMIR